ncbi:lactonase family protein [Roseateles sp.]|uniref:lactonase family protein n=1 Tax=Roseateles sp. TaxID=1971397 RepID=UPI00391D70F1
MSVRPSHAQPGPQAYLGGYGRAGLRHLRQDPSSGELQELQGMEVAGEPSWLCASPDGRLLYSANEGSSTLTVYERGDQGRLQPLQELASGGRGPVHISLHAGMALVAHYGSGQLACWRLGEQGLLDGAPRVLDTAQWPGPSHAHMAACDPQGRFLLVSDLGQDALLCWRFEPGLGPQGRAQVWRTPAGSGPRHFQFHASLPGQLYLLNETASSLSWLELEPHSGGLSHKLTLSSLPKGYSQTSYASDLRLSPSGRHLYALNRLHDSIAIFELNAEGRPRLLGHEPTRGSYPRSACFGPDGRWFYTCNQRGDSLSRFWVRSDGGLHYAGQQAMPSPAMLLFVG